MDVVQFEDLKLFRTEFKHSKKESRKYFEGALKNSTNYYLGQVKAEGNEKLHILYSWSEVSKFLSIALMVVALLGVITFDFGTIVSGIVLSASLITMLVSRILLRQYIRTNYGLAFTIDMLRADKGSMLEDQRRELLEK